MEQRERTRYKLRLPITYRWTDEQGVQQQAGGFTRNISTQGLFVAALQLPPNGAELSFQAVLPPLEEAAEVIPLRAAGRVLRVEGRGFALSSDFGLWRESESECLVETQECK
ncbi:MAG: hypothetical protein ACM3PW_06175 [Chlamydiota bacterium]